MTVIRSISTRYRLPTPLEEVVNSIVHIWAVTRFSNLIPRQPNSVFAAPRTLTLREAAAVDQSPQPLFIKTAIRLPTPVGPQLPSAPDSPNPKTTPLPRQGFQSSQSSNLTMDSFSQKPKPSYVPRKIFLDATPSRKRPAPAEPLLINFPYVGIFATATKRNPSLWEVSLLFRDHSKTCASLDRTLRPMETIKDVIATAFSKRATGMAAVANLARFAGAFYQFALANGYPPAGEDALVAIVQWLKPMRQRGYAVPRIALYSLRVMNEALWRQLPVTAPAVLGASRTLQSRIRKQAPLTPHTSVVEILLLAQSGTMPFGLRAFASRIAIVILATFRWADAQWIAEIQKNDSVAFGICQRTKSNSEPFYWAALLWGAIKFITMDRTYP